MEDNGHRSAAAHRGDERDSTNPTAMDRHPNRSNQHGAQPGRGAQQPRDGLDAVHQAIYRTYK